MDASDLACVDRSFSRWSRPFERLIRSEGSRRLHATGEVRMIASGGAGSSAVFGAARLAVLLRETESMRSQGRLDGSEALAGHIREGFGKVESLIGMVVGQTFPGRYAPRWSQP